MAWVGSDRLAVAIRKGEVWMIDGVLAGQPADMQFHRLPLACMSRLAFFRDGDDFLTAQRSEVTRLSDRDGDGLADATCVRRAAGR